MPRRSSIALLSLALFAALGAVAWIVLRGATERAIERADNSRAAVPNEARSQLAAEELKLEARSAETGEPASKSSASAPENAGTGTLRIRVLDEQTRAPVPDLGFVVYRERGGDKDLAQGTTDAQGRAEFRDLEANTILVRTERRPPFASQVAGVWLVAGATKELEILVDPGSAVTGRVVDDLKQPVSGAGFFLVEKKRECRLDDPDAVAQSGTDGRFRIECVANTPRGVWIVGGKTRPEEWFAAEFTLVKDVVQRPVHASVKDGEDLDLGDLELDRAATFTGTVVDAGKRGIAGALVSAREERSTGCQYPVSAPGGSRFVFGPGGAGFQLAAKETLCDLAGAFELRVAPREQRVHVWTLDGQFQTFALPSSAPGERKDGLILELATVTRIDLELVDSRGARIRSPVFRPAHGGVRPSWSRLELDGGRRLGVDFRTQDGRILESTAPCAPDGIWRAQLPLDPAAIDELTVSLYGYEPIRERVAGALTARETRKYTLIELPKLRVRVVPKDPHEKWLEDDGTALGIQACQVRPERRDAILRSGGSLSCCGLGSGWYGMWYGDALELELPLRSTGEFWIYASGWGKDDEGRTFVTLGPLRPSDELHEIVLDAAQFRSLKWSYPESNAQPGPNGADKSDAEVHAEFVDAASGDGVDEVRLEFESVGAADGADMPGWAFGNDEGLVQGQVIRPGRWKVQASSRGYRLLDLGVREARAGERLDLGRIALQPLPVYRGRVLTADGAAGAGLWLDEVSGALSEDGGGIRIKTRDDGNFEIHCELPAHVLLDVRQDPTGAGYACGAQRFALDGWAVGEVRELKLRPLRRVLVRLLGAGVSRVDLYACPAAGEPTANCDPRKPDSKCPDSLVSAHELDPEADSQRFELYLAPGRYQVWGGGMLYDVSMTELTVPAGEGSIELTVTAH